MVESVDDPVFLPVGSDRYCHLVLNSQFWSISTFDTFPYNEHREFERTVLGKAENFDERYPSWNVKLDRRYYDKDKITGAIHNFTRDVQTYVETASPGRMSGIYAPDGSYIGDTNGVSITGREDRIYPYIANKMNSTHPTLWAYAWSHGVAGKLRFSVGDGLCYLPDGTTTPPLALQIPERVPKYLGNAAPPPPPPKDMNCCDCNTIATIIEDKIISQLKSFGESLKDHIDLRTKEEIQIHKQQLEAMEIDLQPLFKRLNEVERNLWNGILK